MGLFFPDMFQLEESAVASTVIGKDKKLDAEDFVYSDSRGRRWEEGEAGARA